MDACTLSRVLLITVFLISVYKRFYRTVKCLFVRNAMHGIAKDFLSVCLSVRPSVKRVDCDKTRVTCAHIFISHEKSFILVF